MKLAQLHKMFLLSRKGRKEQFLNLETMFSLNNKSKLQQKRAKLGNLNEVLNIEKSLHYSS